jgi:hypothetical protein
MARRLEPPASAAEGRSECRQACQAAKRGIVVQDPDEASDALVRVVIDAALEVHESLGPAFVESVCENALCYERNFGERHLRTGCRRGELTP